MIRKQAANMYRRIELINEYPDRKPPWQPAIKHGLMGISHMDVADAWFCKLRGPGKRYFKTNARFYFTEKGWSEVGSKVVEACKKVKQRFRILTVKEKSVNVVWKDPLEVAAQPIKRTAYENQH